MKIRTIVKVVSLCSGLMAASGAARAQSNADGAAQAYQQGYNQVLDRNWSAALATFGALVEQYPGSDWADDAEFWRCYARDELGEAPSEVFGCYDNHLASYRRSEWSDDAKRAMVRLARQLDGQGQKEYSDRVRRFGRSDDDNRMLQVLAELGEIGDERSLEVIIQHLDATTDEQLRARITDVLEDIDLPAASEKLRNLVFNDPSIKVQRTALHALTHHESASVTPTLMSVLDDQGRDPELRSDALEYLVELEPAGLIDLLTEAIRGTDDRLAMTAIDELSDREDRQALNVLVALLGEVPHQRRRLSIVDEMEDFEMPEAATALLKVAQSDPDPRVRRAATESLGDMETPAAREALIELLQGMGTEQ
ncbi:MAG: HEAT repeat domain-containing protein [Pseudomonadota bacterium]